ncbi:class II aldolase/adducin family protein [Cellvibrio sp. PSBB023]|uniref:class II aldolase/adducin family protein n=1 Tax=Cellvibrio sp. PSBB023 TaxID=1945512 RepID=UPI00098E8D55|nr:class II aldolase/adducin family protein [Cellvibrio sp. PSBB023]AQT61382.1 hypothetical protein B0D95_15660 [Cellvibrio sp. PSBB023]
MKNPESSLKAEISQLCSTLGEDSLLVQAAGGNVSWKQDDKTLWIKASGTRLAEANIKDIFIPVDLTHTLDHIHNNEFNFTPRVLNDSQLRPSIETLLHALMPQRIVVHIHAVEILAYLVRSDCDILLKKILGEKFEWVTVNYFKPGAELASAAWDAIQNNSKCNIVLMKNHGVVFAAESTEEVLDLIEKVIRCFKEYAPPTAAVSNFPENEVQKKLGMYNLVEDKNINLLATSPKYFNRLNSHWSLYPDHVVFLGNKANIFASWDEFSNVINAEQPELIFILSKGVYALDSFNQAKKEQLLCYFNVISRIPDDSELRILSNNEIAALLNWDAEQYRKNIAS